MSPSHSLSHEAVKLMNTFTGHRRWGSVIAWGLNISFIQDGTANTRLYYTKIVANLAPFLCSIICVFGENLKHVIQIPCKDFEGMRWLELMHVRLPAPRHSCTCWTGHGTQKLGATFLSTGRKVTTYLPWTEQFSPSESQRITFKVRLTEFILTEILSEIQSHWITELQTLQESKQVLHWDLRHGWECLGRQGGGPYKQALKKFTFKRIMKECCIKWDCPSSEEGE